MKTHQFDLSRRSMLRLAGAAAAAVTLGTGRVSAAMMKTAMPTAKLFYTESGITGKNVLLLHGWTCDSHDWSWQLPAFENKYHVVSVDLRGHGRSAVMASGAYTPSDYVADIESLIMTQYPGQKFNLIGHSMGAQIAARLAAKRPDLVSAVVSVDGSLGFSTDLAPIFQKTVNDLHAGDPRIVGPALFERFYNAKTDPAFRRWHARRLQGTPLQVIRESFGPLFLGADQVGMGKQSEDFCRSLTVPFYHLCRDPAQAIRMRPWFLNPMSKVDIWTDTGHWIMQDRKDDVNAEVTAWIDQL